MEHLSAFWSPVELLSNSVIMLNVLGAMLLGLALGYERSFHGHAAGMRTYALVCMSSAALTALGGYPGDWFGGTGTVHGEIHAEATHVIQGIVTGIGFLGAGVILKEGFTIRGLSTAASILATSAIGIITGVGFYATAILTTLLVIIVMSSFKRLELTLPHRRQLRLVLSCHADHILPAASLAPLMQELGYNIVEMACQSFGMGKDFEYALVLQGDGTHNFNSLTDKLAKMEILSGFALTPIRD